MVGLTDVSVMVAGLTIVVVMVGLTVVDVMVTGLTGSRLDRCRCHARHGCC
jgi:hypothetical protein